MKLKTKIRGLDGLFKFMRPSTQRRIAKNVTNKLLVRAKRESINNINREYNLPKRAISSKLKIERAKANKLAARIYAPNRRLNVIEFRGTKATGSGVVATIRKGKKTVYPKGFIAQPKGRSWSKYGQSKQVSSPKKLALQRKGGSPYPVKGILVWTLAQIIGGHWNRNLINKMIKREIKAIADHELEKEFRKTAGIRR